jgi:hypothetical protein
MGTCCSVLPGRVHRALPAFPATPLCTPTLIRPDNEREGGHVSQIGLDGRCISERDRVIRRELFPSPIWSRAEVYQRYARECVEIAPTFQDEEARATLLGQAQAWLRLAHLAQANRQIAELAVAARSRACNC